MVIIDIHIPWTYNHMIINFFMPPLSHDCTNIHNKGPSPFQIKYVVNKYKAVSRHFYLSNGIHTSGKMVFLLKQCSGISSLSTSAICIRGKLDSLPVWNDGLAATRITVQHLTSTPAVITFRPKQNGYYFADSIFKRILLNDNFCILIQISRKYIPTGPVTSIGSNNGLAPNRRKTIIWTKYGLIYWRIYASLGLNGLILFMPCLYLYLNPASNSLVS